MKIHWSRFAVNDRKSIFNYIEVDNPRAAATLDSRIQAQVESLVRTPEIGRVGRIAGTRELVLAHTPYITVYRIEAKTVKILRILHGAQLWPDEISD